jgi:hypothetical protein
VGFQQRAANELGLGREHRHGDPLAGQQLTPPRDEPRAQAETGGAIMSCMATGAVDVTARYAVRLGAQSLPCR